MKNKLKNQKLLALLFVAVTFFTTALKADEVKYDDSWGKQGFSVTNQKSSGLEIIYSINSFSLKSTQINGEAMTKIELPGVILPNNEGAPDLPGTGRYIAIPNSSKVSVKVIATRTEKFTGVEIAPSPRIPWDTEDGPLDYNKDQTIYSSNSLYPSDPVIISDPDAIRGVDVIMLGITPFQYNPATKELIVYRDIKIEVTFEGGNSQIGDNRLRSRWWDPLLEDMLLNSESLTKIDYNKIYQNSTKETGCEYLIITANNAAYQSWADSIKKFRTNQGILTKIMTVDEVGGNNVNTIESFINDAYNTWDIPPAACLLIGDYGSNSDVNIMAPIWDNYCASDNIYADVNNNKMPDIVFARIPAGNTSEVEIEVTKFLDYEKNPPTSSYFYSHPVTALGFQTERWFQICSEAVAGFWENELGKSTVRINKTYIGNPNSDPWSTATNTSTVVNVFGPNGLGYIPSTPGQVNCTWYGSAGDVVNAINSGAFMLQHRDHGSEQGWGEPSFGSSNINSLNNTDLTFIWSINCLTGKYNLSSDCFAEKFYQRTSGGNNAGALGIVAASEVSYSFVNDTYVWGCYDNMWPEFLPTYGTNPDSRGILPAFANAAGKYFLQQSSWPYNTSNKEVTYNLFHMLGGAFTTVYSEVPQYLTVTHEPIFFAGLATFEITADEGSLIALTVNGEIIGTGEGTGSQISIPVPSLQPQDFITVTVTKQNYYRYESQVEVLPPTGPYIIKDSYYITDDGVLVNGDMNPDENILLTVTLKNIGVEQADNVSVTLSSDDPYVSITDDNEDIGNIAAGSLVTIENGFAWYVHNDIPNLHTVLFTLTSTDGTDNWVTQFSIEAKSPALEIGNFTIDDSDGNNNGRLDPGETAIVKVETTNNGSSFALMTGGMLTPTSTFISMENNTYNFNVIAIGETKTAEFTVTASEEATNGTPYLLQYKAQSLGFITSNVYSLNIGFASEDWETGDMSKYDWVTSGDADWLVSEETPYEGTYCAKTGDIGDGETTTLSIDYTVGENGTISFYYKVSSQQNYDKLKFYIDNTIKAQWSGEIDWTHVSYYNISPGEHTFKWSYVKSANTSSGDDCGWVDMIILPDPVAVTAFAGEDASLCEDDTFNCEGFGSPSATFEWTTTGTGTFADFTDPGTVYTPGDEDYQNGSVDLTLAATVSGQTSSDDLTLSLHYAPVVDAGENTEACSNSFIPAANAENYESVVWTTTGDGTFNDNSVVNPEYVAGEADIENGEVALIMTVNGYAPCGTVMDTLLMSITAAPEAFAGEDHDICEGQTYEISDAVSENYSDILWETSGDGAFDNVATVNPVYTPGPNDINTEEVILTLTAAGNGVCEAATDEMLLTIKCLGIDDNLISSKVSIFPNPNSGTFTIKIDSEIVDPVNIRILNSLGKSVYSSDNVKLINNNSLNVNINVDGGLYYLHIENDNYSIVKKIIIH
jgi:hypothetical protein